MQITDLPDELIRKIFTIYKNDYNLLIRCCLINKYTNSFGLQRLLIPFAMEYFYEVNELPINKMRRKKDHEYMFIYMKNIAKIHNINLFTYVATEINEDIAAIIGDKTKYDSITSEIKLKNNEKMNYNKWKLLGYMGFAQYKREKKVPYRCVINIRNILNNRTLNHLL